MLSVKQGGIKYHFSSFWYESTLDWTQVSRAIGEHSNHHANYHAKSKIKQFYDISTLADYSKPGSVYTY